MGHDACTPFPYGEPRLSSPAAQTHGWATLATKPPQPKPLGPPTPPSFLLRFPNPSSPSRRSGTNMPQAGNVLMMHRIPKSKCQGGGMVKAVGLGHSKKDLIGGG